MPYRSDSWNEADYALTVEATVELLRTEAAEIALEDPFVGELLGRLANGYEFEARELGKQFLYR